MLLQWLMTPCPTLYLGTSMVVSQQIFVSNEMGLENVTCTPMLGRDVFPGISGAILTRWPQQNMTKKFSTFYKR